MGMVMDRHTCGYVGTQRCSPRHNSTRRASLSSLCPAACVGLERPQTRLEKTEPVTNTPSPTASRANGGEVLRGHRDDFLQEIFVPSSQGKEGGNFQIAYSDWCWRTSLSLPPLQTHTPYS